MRERLTASGMAMLLTLAIASAGAAHAGGVYLYETDAASTSLASAGWTARAEDAGTIFSNPADILLASEDATSITADRRYRDVWHGALGARKRLSDPWDIRFGVSNDSSMVEDADRTPDLPIGASTRLAAGADYRYSKAAAIAFGYELAWGGNLPMDVNRGPLAGHVAGEYSSTAIHVLSGTWRKAF